MASSAVAVRREVKVLALISVAHFLSHFYMTALVPLYPLIQPEIGATWSGIGAAITAFALCTGLLQTPVGFIVDRVGGRKVLVVGLFVFAAAIGLVGFATSLWHLIALMALAGIGNSVFHPADYSIISAAVDEKRLGRAFSLHTFGGSAGIVAAPIIMVALHSLIGWRAAVMAVGVIGVVLALVIFMLSGLIGEGGETKKKEGDGNGWRELLTSRPLLAMFLFYVCAAAANSGIMNFSIKAFGDIYGMSLTAAAVALTVYQGSALAGVLPGGWLADRTGRHDLIMISCFLASGIMVVLAGIGVLPFWLVIVVLGTAGAARGLVNSARDVSVRHVAGSHSVGTAFAFVTTGFLIGQAIGPPIYGMLIDIGSPEIVFWISGAFSFLGVCTVFVTRSGRRKGVDG